jgi:hypothetical protein
MLDPFNICGQCIMCKCNTARICINLPVVSAEFGSLSHQVGEGIGMDIALKDCTM